MSFYAQIVQMLAVLAVMAMAFAVVLTVANLVPAGRKWLRETLAGHAIEAVSLAWFASLVSMVGSLYLSDVVDLPPCLMCWYQRIAMYPLVFVLGVGLFRKDPGVWRFGLPLSLIGLAISGYHVAVQLRPTLDVLQCGTDTPCSSRYFAVFGFVSIPVLAVAAFMLITVLLLTVQTVQSTPAADGSS